MSFAQTLLPRPAASPVVRKKAFKAGLNYQADAPKSAWLVSPSIDLLFVCGLAPWLLGLGAFVIAGPLDNLVLGPQESLLSILFVLASLIIGEGHQFTSIIRYYTGYRNRKKSYFWNRVPIWGIYAGLITVALLLLDGLVSPAAEFIRNSLGGPFGAIASFAMALFPVVLMQHVCAQAKSIGLIYCGTQGHSLPKLDRFLLSALTFFLSLAGASTIAMPFGLTSSFDGLFALGQFVDYFRLAVMFLSQFLLCWFAFRQVRRGLQSGEWMPVGAGLLWTNLAVWVLAPVPSLVYVWLFVPLFYHATQHWCVAWAVRRKELVAAGRTNMTRGELQSEFVKMVLPVQALSLAILFAPLLVRQAHLADNAQDMSSLFGSDTLSLGWSLLIFYMHYFADRVVWRPQ